MHIDSQMIENACSNYEASRIDLLHVFEEVYGKYVFNYFGNIDIFCSTYILAVDVHAFDQGI